MWWALWNKQITPATQKSKASGSHAQGSFRWQSELKAVWGSLDPVSKEFVGWELSGGELPRVWNLGFDLTPQKLLKSEVKQKQK